MVIGLLLGFVTLSVLWLVRTVGRNIRDRSIELLSNYDWLLEQRSRELSALDAEIEHREAELEKTLGQHESEAESALAAEPTSAPSVTFLKTAEMLSTTPYQDDGTGAAYQRIRQTFSAIQDIDVMRLAAQAGSRHEGSAGTLLRALPFEIVYQLSTLTGAEQLRLLRETLPAELQGTLESYAAVTPRFDCIAFYDALKASAAAETGSVRLHIAPQDIRPYPAAIDVTVDEDICEGFQIEADNVLYDYAIKTREIS